MTENTASSSHGIHYMCQQKATPRKQRTRSSGFAFGVQTSAKFGTSFKKKNYNHNHTHRRAKRTAKACAKVRHLLPVPWLCKLVAASCAPFGVFCGSQGWRGWGADFQVGLRSQKRKHNFGARLPTLTDPIFFTVPLSPPSGLQRRLEIPTGQTLPWLRACNPRRAHAS